LSELVSTRIRNTAGKLGLPHLAETINEYTRRADEGKVGYLDFLDLVLSEELAVRDDRRFRQGLRLSRLPHHKTLDEYDFSFQPDLDPRKVKDLATLSFVDGKANAALLGPPGVGKTHIAVALAVAACRAGYSIYFTSLDDMVRNLKTAEAAGRLTNKLGTYLRPSVLVVDEVGYQPLERAEANLVFQVISKRYEKGSIILTSNKTFSKAHMFRRTCARCCRNFTGSSGGRDGRRHRVGDQRDQLLRPAIRLLCCDLSSAGIADEVGAVQAVESAASVEAPTVRVSGHPRDVVGIEHEHAGVRADRIAQNYGRDRLLMQCLSAANQPRPPGSADTASGDGGSPGTQVPATTHAMWVSLQCCFSSFPAWLRGRESALVDMVGEIDQCGLRIHSEGGSDELGIHGVDQVDEAGAADHAGRVSAVVKDMRKIGS
jgi:DNA replication protein DnaC